MSKYLDQSIYSSVYSSIYSDISTGSDSDLCSLSSLSSLSSVESDNLLDESEWQDPKQVIIQALLDDNIQEIVRLHQQDPITFSGTAIYNAYLQVEKESWHKHLDIYTLTIQPELFDELINRGNVKQNIYDQQDLDKIFTILDMLVERSQLQQSDMNSALNVWIQQGKSWLQRCNKKFFCNKIHDATQRKQLAKILSYHDLCDTGRYQ